jgi:hypothetical protein
LPDLPGACGNDGQPTRSDAARLIWLSAAIARGLCIDDFGATLPSVGRQTPAAGTRFKAMSYTLKGGRMRRRLRSVVLPHSALALLAGLALCLATSPSALTMSGDELALDYLIQKVCIDPAGRVLAVDPYSCPVGDTLRPLEPDEALPYHRFDQPAPGRPEGLQRRDSYPVRTAGGREIVVATFDHAPFGAFKPDRDGYSVYVVRDGWVSSEGTRAGGHDGTTFFGAGCKPYNGWVFFPVAALDARLISPGSAQMPIRGVHWEKNGEPFPGPCPTAYRTDVVTSWQPLPAFQFGGIGGNPVKTLPAVLSVHGFTRKPGFLARGHLEVFFFTRLYGPTRWESWAPAQRYELDPGLHRRAALAGERCVGPAQNTYRGVLFYRIACRDWTDVVVPPRPEAPPFWPVPELGR